MNKTVSALAALIVTALIITALAMPARADDEASNRPLVVTSQYGNCYARSIPSGTYGNEGRTQIFLVEAEADRLIHTYDWYAHTLRLECNVAGADGSVGVSVVGFGPWARGQAADDETLALAFYWNGRLLRRYSTLDLAERPDNVQASISHYTVIDGVIGYQSIAGNRYAFAVRLVDGRELVFDAGAGALVQTIEDGRPRLGE